MGSHSRSTQSRHGKSGSSSSTYSDGSDHSRSTAPTVCSDRPFVRHFDPSDPYPTIDPRDSMSTYASTEPSLDDDGEDVPYEVVEERHEAFPSNPIPSNPSTFAVLFPSTRRMVIRHDDTTIDGNMNLRVDNLIPDKAGRQQEVTLFHLRMHDLHKREFSFRRYCRDSGREVCHSTRKRNAHGVEKRPVLERSLSTVLERFRRGSSGSTNTTTALKRLDPGTEEEALFDDESTSSKDSLEKSAGDENTILLEFSNYAHVEVKRRGSGSSKRYEFEYWSTRYQWRREYKKDGEFQEISFHLVDMATSKAVAHIVPEPLTPMESIEEKSKGGWIPPSSLWISDSSVYEKMHDVADVFVATGLIALVDDWIRRRWHKKRQLHLSIPRKASFIDHVDTRKLIEGVFHRRGSADSRYDTQQQASSHP
ncbi:hypothetical protein DTO169E5_3368 [Paecilomyces variotii]|nr:hypothetical protein DTO169E5_3368 [Paecilomyces variotii]KAJ9306774.1 hypothetical protein DTO217A2_3761 [Paecilomyces variotii]KAJ9405015.1 hypothetical protein DTO045G8_7188 [Paecilomyces variotii]